MSAQPEMVTLTSTAAHNAVAGLVSLYQAVLSDHAREKALLQGSVAAMRAEVDRLDKELSKQAVAMGCLKSANEALVAQCTVRDEKIDQLEQALRVREPAPSSER